MKTAHRNPESGIAIIIVMVSIFALTMIAAAFAFSMKVETKLAAFSNDECEMEWMARSGVEKARYLLGEEMILPGPGQRYDSLDEKWAGGSSETNEVLAGITLEDTLGHGKYKITITDNERKFNINLAQTQTPILEKALILIGADASDVSTIVASVQDWLDRDDQTRVNGAETEYYQTMDPPYDAKNGPIDDLSELLLIKGVTPDLYWGPNSSNHPASLFQGRQRPTTGPAPAVQPLPVGMVDLFTPVSVGLINILTASSAQLQMIPGIDESIADQIIQLRSETGADGMLIYRSPVDLLVNTSLGRQLAPQVAAYCSIRSFTFDVQVDVEVGQSRRTYHALLRRNSPRDVHILGMYWE